MKGERKRPGSASVGVESSLRLEWRSPDELEENPKNWRRHPQAQVAAISDALSEVGWAGACLYNERTKRLVDGHARRKIAIAAGTEKIPVLVGNWTQEEEDKILATLDPIGQLAETNSAALECLLKGIKSEGDGLSDLLAMMSASDDSKPVDGWGGVHENANYANVVAYVAINVKDVAAFESLVAKVAGAGERPIDTIMRALNEADSQGPE